MNKDMLTDAQQRALRWLPGDGSWVKITGHAGAAINSLALYHKMAETERRSGPRGGRAIIRWAHLTDKGVSVRGA